MRALLVQNGKGSKYAYVMQLCYEACKDNGMNPTWVQEEHCLVINPPGIKDLFVFEKFEGRAFAHLKKFHSSRVLGPRAFLSFVADEKPILERGSIIFNAAMWDCSVCCDSAISENEWAILQERVLYMGGTFTSISMPASTTHLVVRSVRDSKYRLAINAGISVMTTQWVDAVWQKSLKWNVLAQDEEFHRYNCPAFLGLNISLSNISPRVEADIKKLVEENGGACISDLVAGVSNMLVVEGWQESRLAQIAGIPCVEVAWVYESVRLGYAIETTSNLTSMGCYTPLQVSGASSIPEVDTDFGENRFLEPSVEAAYSSNSTTNLALSTKANNVPLNPSNVSNKSDTAWTVAGAQKCGFSRETTTSAPRTRPGQEKPVVTKPPAMSAPETPCVGSESPKRGIKRPMKNEPYLDRNESPEHQSKKRKSMQRQVFVTDVTLCNDTLLVFGRAGASSICAVVEFPKRSAYLQLREDCTFDELRDDFSSLAPAMGIVQYSAEVENKASAFDNQLPCVGKFLHVTYSGVVDWSRHLSGRTYSRVLGRNNEVEELTLSLKLGLPCLLNMEVRPWLSSGQNALQTTCTETVLVSDLQLVEQQPESDAPALIVAALNVTFHRGTVESFSLLARKRSAGHYRNVGECYHQLSCAIGDGVVEGHVLSALAAAVQGADPDVIVAHTLLRDLHLLLARFRLLCVDASPLGRVLHRCYEHSEFGLSFQLREAFIGRVVIDLMALSKELDIPCRNYRLPVLLESVLEQPFVGEPIVIQLFVLEAALGAIQVVFALSRLTWATPACVARLGRAHRVEKMLAAEFHREGFILPEKTFKARKPAGGGYTGGLVLEPKVGVFQEHTLLLDYSSLYPSLIIEHGVCFANRKLHPMSNQTDIQVCPGELAPALVLPALMIRLLNERSAVASTWHHQPDEVGRRRVQAVERALKMSANAIYGCLGSATGRFSAVYLAAHVAELGRAQLRSAAALVLSKGYEVAYGDTDSLLVLTPTSDTSQSLRIASELLQALNAGSRNMQMKLEAVFERLMIASKKNYAGRTAEVPSLHRNKVVMKGLFGNRTSNPRAIEALFKQVLENVWSEGTQQQPLVAILNKFRRELPTMELAQHSASETVNRELEMYVAPPRVAIVAKRLVRETGVRIGPGDSLEIVPVMQDNDVQKDPIYMPLWQAQQEGKTLDVTEWMGTYVMPAIRQVTVGTNAFSPPLQSIQLARYLGLSEEAYQYADPRPATPREPLFVSLSSQGKAHKEHISFRCPVCQWSVPLNAGGYNATKKGFTLERCQNLCCGWHPYLDTDYVSSDVNRGTLNLLKFIGFDRCSAQLRVIHKSLDVPQTATLPALVAAYRKIQSNLDSMLATQPWACQSLSYAADQATKYVQRHLAQRQ